MAKYGKPFLLLPPEIDMRDVQIGVVYKKPFDTPQVPEVQFRFSVLEFERTVCLNRTLLVELIKMIDDSPTQVPYGSS